MRAIKTNNMKNKTFNAIAVKPITNWCGVELAVCQSDSEKLCYRYMGKVGRRPVTVHSTSNGRAYVAIYNTRYYLDEFIRVNIF